MTRKEKLRNKIQTKKDKRREKYDNIDLICHFNKIVQAFILSKKNVSWKSTILHFELTLARSVFQILDKIINVSIDGLLKFNVFTLNERGKIRIIKSINVDERVIQHALCDNIIVPYLSSMLIYDNSASVKNKGTTFAIERFKTHLHRFFRSNNQCNKGYIIQIDIRHYFDSISHLRLEEMIEKLFDDKIIKKNIYRVINSFESEYGLGLGTQLSQILAVYYLNGIDHYIKEQLYCKYYARYMDDSYIICKSYKEALYILNEVNNLYENIGLELHKDKTKIIDLSEEKPIVYLKKNFILTKTGKVIVYQNKQSISHFAYKMKKLYKLYEKGVYQLQYLVNIYNMFQGCNKKYITYKYYKKLENKICEVAPDIFV